jgi:hypothetical protein
MLNMTISSTERKRADKAREPKRQRGKSDVDSSDQIGVLIRLPHLFETETTDDPAAEESEESPPRNTLPIDAAPLREEVAAVESEVDQAGETSDPVPPHDDDDEIRPAFDPKELIERLKVPRMVWQAGILGAVVLLIVWALMSIGGGDKDRLVAETDQEETEVIGDQLPEIPPPSFDPGTPGSLSIDMTSVTAEPSPPAPAETSPPAADTGTDELEMTAPQLEPMTPREEATTPAEDVAKETAVEESTAEASSSEQPSKASSEEQGAVENEIAAGEPLSEAPDTTADDQPVYDPSPPSEAEVTAREYPTTQPSRYMYPSNYEQLFGTGSDPAGSRADVPANDGSGSIYDWQPSTARLQPRIDPPPIR